MVRENLPLRLLPGGGKVGKGPAESSLGQWGSGLRSEWVPEVASGRAQLPLRAGEILHALGRCLRWLLDACDGAASIRDSPCLTNSTSEELS